MSASSHWRVAARNLAILGLLALSGGKAEARIAPQLQPATIGPPGQHAPIPVKIGPFGLNVSHRSALAVRWRRLQPVIHLEVEALALCRANRKNCTPAASRFLSIIEAGRPRTGRARIGAINRAVNLAIRPLSDEAQFGVADVWTTPLMTFATGTGDCEDYAIAKYVALRQAGMAAHDLRLVILHDRLVHEDHAVTAARLNGHWLILDNRRMALLTDTQERNVTPLLALDSAPEESPPVIATAPISPAKTAADDRLTDSDRVRPTVSVSDIFFPTPNKIAPGFRQTMAA